MQYLVKSFTCIQKYTVNLRSPVGKMFTVVTVDHLSSYCYDLVVLTTARYRV